MSSSINLREMAADLEALHGAQAPSAALIRMAMCNGVHDHAGVFWWRQVFNLLMAPRAERPLVVLSSQDQHRADNGKAETV